MNFVKCYTWPDFLSILIENDMSKISGNEEKSW